MPVCTNWKFFKIWLNKFTRFSRFCKLNEIGMLPRAWEVATSLKLFLEDPSNYFCKKVPLNTHVYVKLFSPGLIYLDTWRMSSFLFWSCNVYICTYKNIIFKNCKLVFRHYFKKLFELSTTYHTLCKKLLFTMELVLLTLIYLSYFGILELVCNSLSLYS